MNSLEEAFVNAFETTAFSFLDENNSDVDTLDDTHYFLTSCNFSGGVNGNFSLIIHQSTIEEYLNFLFDNEYTITSDLLADTTKELANILCGNLITEQIDSNVDYYIDSPQFQQLNSLHLVKNIDAFSSFLASNKFCGFLLTITKHL